MESTYELLLERLRRLLVLPHGRQLAFTAAAVEHLARRMHERLEKESLDKVVDHTMKLLWEALEGKGTPSSDLAEAQSDLKELAPPQDDEENEDIGYMLTAVLYACDLSLAADPEESIQGLLYGVDNGVQFHTLQMLGDVDAGTADSRVADEVQEEIDFHFGLLEKLERPDVELDRATLLGETNHLAGCPFGQSAAPFGQLGRPFGSLATPSFGQPLLPVGAPPRTL